MIYSSTRWIEAHTVLTSSAKSLQVGQRPVAAMSSYIL